MTPKVNMPAEETETHINYPVDKWAEVYTTDKNIMKRYEKFIEKCPERCKLIKEDKYSMTFSVHPKSAGLYPRAPRKVSDTQREAAAERLKQARLQKQK